LRKPNLRLDILKNDPTVPKQVPYVIAGGPPPDVNWLGLLSKDSATQHPSQYWGAAFKAADEPPEILNRVRLQLKFGVLRITNLPRSLRHRHIKCGNATSVTVDLSIMPILGSTDTVVAEKQKWPESKNVIWYCDGWDDVFMAMRGARVSADTINELKKIDKNPIYLLNTYLKRCGNAYNMLSPSRIAYVWLFFTIAGIQKLFWTTSGIQESMPSKYRLKVGIATAEMQVKEYYYEMYIRSWNEFTIRPIDKNY
jgi:hypothetical protein